MQELDDDQANIIKNILHDPISISGHYFEHMWFVNEQNVLYEGHITSVKCSSKSSIPKVTATYWKPGKSEGGDDVTMTIFCIFGRFHVWRFVHRLNRFLDHSVESIIDFTTDFKSIVKSRHDFTVKSSALDLRLILLSNQLRINN